MGQPLEGMKIIDLTSALSGPFCTMILGDLGAEVIKIEEPKAGDMNRHSGPFIAGEGAYFLYANRNKKSMTLNLREEEGRDILIKLVKDADILVENFRPGVKFRLKIDYETLKEINPKLIYCSISGFGQTGPWAERPGFDQIAQGMSGLMSVTGFPGSGPTRVGVAIGDSVCGIYAAYGILAALLERNRSGVGQHVQTSLLEGLISILGFQAAKYFGTNETPLQQGNDHATIAPYGTYKTKDGYINIAAGTQQMWEKLCEVLDLRDLMHDPRFEKIPERVKNKDVLRELVEEKLGSNPSDHWIETLNREGIPCGPIYTLDQVFRDQQVLHQEMFFQVDHPMAGKIDMIGFPVKFGRTKCEVALAPPYFGQHTADILSSLEYSKEEIESLRRKGIISK
jgi:crotonobetainyl-CoA:carnitine CoA-transferase CaiB-like acyl-CoA transferase